MKIAVFGTGYVGLVAATCFADAGLHVTGVDIDEGKIQKLKDGVCPIYEPGLTELLRSTLDANRIEFTTDAQKAVQDSQVIFIAVGTPEDEDGSADLSHVLNVAKTIGQSMNEEKVIVLKSTVPVGTSDKVRELLDKTTTHDYDVVSNPEFLKEGASLDDFFKPDRVVIGFKKESSRDIMQKLYAPFVRNGNPILFMSNRAAELTKYAANAFLATKISFINELAQLADSVGADIEEVKKGFTSDSRINPAFFFAGVGYGGSCFPKDVKALIKTGESHGVAMSVIRATDEVNERQKKTLFKKIKQHFGDVAGKTIALWGIAFKPRTDDVREAPSFSLINALLESGANVKAYDPVAMDNGRKQFGDKVYWGTSSLETLDGADGLAIVTEWNEFRNPDLSDVGTRLKEKVIFDGRNIFNPKEVKESGFSYYGIGREV